jgi:hypothetical protein
MLRFSRPKEVIRQSIITDSTWWNKAFELEFFGFEGAKMTGGKVNGEQISLLAVHLSSHAVPGRRET